MTQRIKKRKLSDITFDKDGAHVALVSKDQGGPANGVDYALVMKANNFSQEFVTKMQQIRVTMELPDFLRKFFSMYYEDAEILAKMLGYEKPESEDEFDYDDYLEKRLESFEILKSANDALESRTLPEFLSSLDEDRYLSVLKSQQSFEESLDKLESIKVEKSTKVDTSIASEVNEKEVSASKDKQNLEKSTMDETKPEVVEKSVFESVQKAFEDQKVELQKALETIEAYKTKEKQEKDKSRKTKLEKAVGGDTAKVEVLFKAVVDSTDEDFEAVVTALTEITKAVETSALFQEQGATGESDTSVKESAVARVIKAKQAVKK